jgi:hypothetical protein
MKLFLIEQGVNSDYDTYDSAVVAAATEEDARKMHPNGRPPAAENDYDSTWTSNLDAIKVTYIGVAKPGTQAGVICASFNAG